MSTTASDGTDHTEPPGWLLESLARAVFDLVDASVFAKDRDGRYLMCNDTGARIVGLTPADIVGRTDHQLYEPVIANRFRDHDFEVLSRGRSAVRWVAIPSPDGPVTWYSHLFPLLDPSGEVVGVIGMALDVTERADSEQERRELELRLQQAQRLDTVGQLARGVAHDFNNLLAVMAMQTDLLGSELEAGALENLTELRATIDQASALTRQLLVFSRRDELGDQTTDLRGTLDRLRPLLERSLGTGVRLFVDVPPDVPPIPGDPVQVEQLIVNLAVNARDAMPDGGSLLLRVDVVAEEFVRIVVADTGTGMSEEVRARAFEPFFTTKPPGAGTGLGLSTVHGIAQRSGGVVHLHSRRSGGTAVEVRLPLDRGDGPGDAVEDGLEAARSSSVEEASTGPGGETSLTAGAVILVVDDLEPLRRLASAALDRAGYRTLVAADGVEALRVAAEHPVDLLLTDVVMPGISGRELAEQMLAERPGLPVIYMTGFTAGMLELADHADSAGAEILTKPFAVSELLETIERQLARRP